MRFLLVEDNEKLAQAIQDRMELDGHVIDHAATLNSAEEFILSAQYDLVLLDIMLPDGDGRSFLSFLRKSQKDTPVIAVTARSQVSDRVGILDLGADDYISKPFDFSELEARCRAVLRRRNGAASNTQKIGTIEFNRLAGTVSLNGVDTALRNKELRLFEILADHPNIIFSKSKLVDRLFSYDEDVSENAIEVYIGRLRKHLSGSNVVITTIRGMGYRLSVE
ncbi:response regulator transcription factor [Parasulfitobacter algicola]|uniref:Response regulator transcription factor n=1 Tax=Parasulfitobacter algicola TaxID=2614809 RepID=A0ABX2IT20_9RHOB|nr:response regulator transcription factor [Sulfitobacter algicola]NSX53499.1 response regulator transcription factor [Sulfitobacter algicola]